MTLVIHEPQANGFTAKFWTFYGVISMVYKSVNHGKLWSICFVQQHFFQFPAKFLGKSCARSDVCLVIFLIFFSTLICSFKNKLAVRTFPPVMLKFGSSLFMLRSKIIFTSNQKQNNRRCVKFYSTSFPWSIFSQTIVLEQSARKKSFSCCTIPYAKTVCQDHMPSINSKPQVTSQRAQHQPVSRQQHNRATQSLVHISVGSWRKKSQVPSRSRSLLPDLVPAHDQTYDTSQT